MVDQDAFREVLGQFATGVTVVTTHPEGTTPHGMTVNSFASLSVDPPLVLFNAHKDTNTHEKVAKTDHFAVNILSSEQEWLSNQFAGEHHEMDEPFDDIEYRQEETGAPVFEHTLAYVDCDLYESYPGGDHTIFVGRVRSLAVEDPDADPLTFFRGNYGTIDAS